MAEEKRQRCGYKGQRGIPLARTYAMDFKDKEPDLTKIEEDGKSKRM